LNIEFSNAQDYSSKHIISNDKYSKNTTFIVSIDDTDSNDKSSFIKIDGDGMVQRIKFNMYDNMRIRISMPDGSDLEYEDEETYSPLPPNHEIQISAVFNIKKI